VAEGYWECLVCGERVWTDDVGDPASRYWKGTTGLVYCSAECGLIDYEKEVSNENRKK